MRKKYDNDSRREEVISMFVGLGVVILVVLIIITLISRFKGNISVPGISIEKKTENITPAIDDEKNTSDKKEYIVLKGDNLWNISEKYFNDGFRWQEIAKANNIKNPNILIVGQKLVIPTIENEIKEVPSEHKVVAGDTLWDIAVLYFNDGYQWQKLYRFNRDRLNSPDKLEIGMMVKLK